MKDISSHPLHHHVIKAYRNMIYHRYDYDHLIRSFSIPDCLSKEHVDAIRAYFLDYIYPEIAVRKKIDTAFMHMDKHLLRPKKLLQLLGNLTWITIRFGMYLPQAIQAAYTTLSSYKAASLFETELLHSAEKMDIPTPITMEHFEACIAQLPRKKVEQFIHEMDQLILSLTHVRLLEKTISILEGLTHNMKKHRDRYDLEEINGIEIGIQILQNGYLVFKDLSDEQRNAIVLFIKEVEIDHLNRIFNNR